LRKTSNRSLLVIGLLALFLAMAPHVKADFLMTSIDYQISPVAQTAKIGSEILLNMSVINPSNTYLNVSVVVSVTTTSIVLSDLAFPAANPNTAPGGELYVYDGVRTWKVTANYINFGIRSVQLDNTNLIAGWPVANYYSIANASFSAAQGLPASGGTATVDIGTAQTGIVLYDDGNAAHNDVQINPSLSPVPPINAGAGANDGIYNGVFIIRENYGFSVTNASIVGHFNSGGSPAGNDGFVSPARVSIDGIRPSVELPDANPNPFNPNKTVEKFYYYLTEDCSVQLRVFYQNVTVKTLTAQGTGNLTNYIEWDGLDDNGNIKTDGWYAYRFDITDKAGNTGAAYVGDLIITTVDVIVNIESIDTHYIPTNPEDMLEVLAVIQTQIINGTTANLANLGFDPAIYGVGDYRTAPWVYTDLKMYDSSGTLLNTFPRDPFQTTDEDAIYIQPINNPAGYQLIGDYAPYFYSPLGPAPCSATAAPFIHTDPDGILGNDWVIVFNVPFTAMGGGIWQKTEEFLYNSPAQASGEYILKAVEVLVGKQLVNVSPGGILTEKDRCSGLDLDDIIYHAQPSFFRDTNTGIITDTRGYGLSSDPRTAMLYVEADPGVPLPDTSGPRIVPFSEYPSDLATLEPGVVGPANYLKVMLTDDGVGAGNKNMSTFILRDPYGNLVPGQVTWNAGNTGTKTWAIYYIPNSPLILGGKYNATVIPEDAIGNKGAEYDYSFVVTDTSIPVVTNVNVQSSTGSSQELSPSTSTQVIFLVSQIEATLIPGGSAPVDWVNSTIEIQDAAGNAVSGVVSHPVSTNLLLFTPVTALADASYKAKITAVSTNAFQGGFTYSFYISTAGVTYVDVSGTGDNSTTGMVISVNTAANSGITDSTSPTPMTISASSLAVSVVPPASIAANNSYLPLGTAVSFTAVNDPNMPVSFNAALCNAKIRLHYSDADIAVITAQGLTEANLTAWVWNGSAWTQFKALSAPVSNAGDHYIEFSLSSPTPANLNSVPKINTYSLMYVPPSGSAIVSKPPPNTKIFNPGQGPAKIHYTKDAAAIGLPGGTGNVKVYIFSLNGSLLRTMEYQNNTDYLGSFYDSANGHLYYDPDNVNPGIHYYYFLWDGKNDHGTVVRNGMYIIKTEITTTAGTKTVTSRTIALIK
jgi:flagellar hook assembly protein FlgD